MLACLIATVPATAARGYVLATFGKRGDVSAHSNDDRQHYDDCWHHDALCQTVVLAGR